MRQVTRGGESRRGPSRKSMRLAQLVIGFGVVGSLIVGTPAMSSAVPPPPPNPSDSDIAAADSQVSSSVGTVSALINQVASANEQLSALDNEVAIKREDVKVGS